MQALNAREVFERSVSHELRTPLTSVLGHLELLLEVDGLPEAVARHVRVVQRNAARLQYLVSDLLDPAARASGALDLVRVPVDVVALVGEAVEAVVSAARTAGVTVSSLSAAPVRAELDAHRMRQVLENLLSNAVKYTDAGGRVDITVETGENEVTISVADTGIGIAAEDLERLFVPFFRADQARERPSPGVGLGLGIARTIVFAHGGRVEVASQPGQGSLFSVTLPVRSPARRRA